MAPTDLVEEVARLGGYNNIPSIVPLAPGGGGLTRAQRRRRTVGRAMAEAGYVEVLSYPFVAPEVHDAFGLAADDPRRSAVRLTNPLSEEEPQLRTSLLATLLGTLKRNTGRGLRDLALYEAGEVVLPAPAGRRRRCWAWTGARPRRSGPSANAIVPAQPWHLAAVLTGEFTPAGWWGPGRAAPGRTRWRRRGSRSRPRAFRRTGFRYARPSTRRGTPAGAPRSLVDGTVIGHAGELHPGVVSALELPKRTCAMEIDLDAIPAAPVVQAGGLSTYPPALIDVALVVHAEVPAAEVEAALVAGAGELLESVQLFDVYTSEQVGAGMRSLAYKLTFRAPDRTLTVEEAVAARDAAVASAAARTGAVLRGA